MSKKSKKFDADTNIEPSTAPVEAPATAEAAAPAAPVKPKAPAYHLAAEDGTQYRFIRYALPKRASKTPDGDLKLNIDGVDVPAWKTDSKGWSVEGTELTYVYFNLDVEGGISGYLTLQGEDLADAVFTIGQGEAARANPKAQSKLTEEQRLARIEQAKITREANKAKAAAATSTAGSTGTVEGVGLIG